MHYVLPFLHASVYIVLSGISPFAQILRVNSFTLLKLKYQFLFEELLDRFISTGQSDVFPPAASSAARN